MAVFASTLVGRWLDPRTVSWIAGVCFIAVGIWVLIGA